MKGAMAGGETPLAFVGSAVFGGALVRRTFQLLSGGHGVEALIVFRKLLVLQVYFTGVQAVALVVSGGAALSVVALAVGHRTLARFGAEAYFGELMRLLILGELGPLLTALIVIGRSGTAIAAELSRMKIDNEIDAMVVHGVDPLACLGAPRLLGVALANVVLTVFLCASAYLTTVALSPWFETVSRSVFARHLAEPIGPNDVTRCLAKGLLFGIVVPWLAMYQGLRVGRDPNEGPRAVLRAVVSAMIVVFLVDGLVAVLW